MVKNTRRLAGSRRITPDWGDAIIHIIQDFIRESSKGHLSGKAWAHKSRNVREFANSSLWGGYKDSLDPALSDLNGWYRNRSEGIEVGSVGRSVGRYFSFLISCLQGTPASLVRYTREWSLDVRWNTPFFSTRWLFFTKDEIYPALYISIFGVKIPSKSSTVSPENFDRTAF